MSCARAAWSAASSQRPAQNSTQARPQSARALRGSSRSRHSRCSRSSKARASSRFEAGASVFAIACVASCTSCSPPTAVGRSLRPRREIARRLRLAGEPAEDRLHSAGTRPKHVVVELVGELERRRACSSCRTRS